MTYVAVACKQCPGKGRTLDQLLKFAQLRAHPNCLPDDLETSSASFLFFVFLLFILWVAATLLQFMQSKNERTETRSIQNQRNQPSMGDKETSDQSLFCHANPLRPCSKLVQAAKRGCKIFGNAQCLNANVMA